jgi:hypothetical protein
MPVTVVVFARDLELRCLRQMKDVYLRRVPASVHRHQHYVTALRPRAEPAEC